MSNIRVYHNPRCSKSRAVVDYLKEKNFDFEIVEYLKTNPDKKELQTLLKMLGISAHDLMRKGEEAYKLHVKAKNLSEQECLDLLEKYPVLIERPIVVHKDKAIIGRPFEQILTIL